MKNRDANALLKRPVGARPAMVGQAFLPAVFGGQECPSHHGAHFSTEQGLDHSSGPVPAAPVRSDTGGDAAADHHRSRKTAGGRACLFSLALAALICVFGCGPEVEVTAPVIGPIEDSFTEPAKTRLEKTYLISMPIAGLVDRIELEPGDAVSSGRQLVHYDLVPLREALAEAREAVAQIEAAIAVKSDNGIEEILLLEAEEWIKASNELLKAADEEVAAEKARSDRSAKELDRVAELVAQQALSQSALDDAQLDADTAVIELKKQVFTRAAVNIMTTVVALGPRAINEYLDLKKLQLRELTHQLAQARSRLARAERDLALADVTSPIDGIVLRRYEQGDAALPAGTQLLLLGNLEQLEVEVDVLTTDALRIDVGTPVIMEAPPGTVAARGKVKRIEPQAFTKLSSLGVEQQRVRTIVTMDEKSERLGVGYRLEARFLTGAKTEALKVPRSSVLQAPDGSFYVLKVESGRIAETPVEIGLKSDLELEITNGLSPGDLIAAHGDTSLTEGMRVKALQ